MDDQKKIEVKILFFAKARELAGLSECSLKVASHVTYEELCTLIVENFSLGAIRRNFILAVNEEYLSSESILDFKEGDEIAVIPPISGVFQDPQIMAVYVFLLHAVFQALLLFELTELRVSCQDGLHKNL
ncbi:molybdopterin synthase sulfur carrier subunit-like isoform X2 [Schistocerca cancellata]|uniref:molybdopterin synthase sulfur carrier subunit-like isoform X2 n=1 Tax=Schistocerca cancellata TaxID=274614 RepID=UPI00211755A0|nr:molybdopterin synthase sulfur carrier subunit-like isoform X2 [Schistocerca cancellata]